MKFEIDKVKEAFPDICDEAIRLGKEAKDADALYKLYCDNKLLMIEHDAIIYASPDAE